MFGSLDISSSALTAQRIRLDTIAGNIANAHAFEGDRGYQRRVPIFSVGVSADRPGEPGVHVSEIIVDSRPGEIMHDPTHPYADQDGNVMLSNVSELSEMINAMSAARAYDANITVMNVSKGMFDAALRMIA